jgi:hypothetical protein
MWEKREADREGKIQVYARKGYNYARQLTGGIKKKWFEFKNRHKV